MKKMKSIIALVLAIMCTVSFCFADTADTESTFALKDVDTSTELGKSIEKLYNAGVVNGIPESDGSYTYKADNRITRAEFCKMINIVFDYKIMADNIFTDVNPSQWYYIHILPAIYYGYIKGRGDGTFGGTDNITREQVCVILDRIVKKTAENKPVVTDEVSSWAKDAVENIVGLGYIPLEEGGKFRATEPMTRGEFAMALDDFVVIEQPEDNKKEDGKNDGEKEEDKGTSTRPSVGTSSGSSSSGSSSSGSSSSGSSSSGSGNTDSGNTDSGNTDSGNTDSGNTDSGNSGSSTPSVPTYNITYNLDGGNLSGHKKTYTSSDSAYTLLKPTKANHKFMGWFESEDADITSAEPVTEIASGSSGDKIFYAKWAPYYTINYVLTPATYGEEILEENRGKFSEDTAVVYKYTEYDEEFELPTPYRDDGFAFVGWYEAQEFKDSKAVIYTDEYHVTSIPTGSAGNKLYHAVWEDMIFGSEETYIALENAVYDISVNKEIGTLVLTDKSAEIMTLVEEALTEVVAWENENILVNNYLVRQVFGDKANRIREIVASFTPEERTEFEDAMMVGLSTDTLDSMVSIFNINVNFGK